jgi:hypothetical protein
MAHYHAFWKNQPGRGMARTKVVIDKAIEATMTPAVKKARPASCALSRLATRFCRRDKIGLLCIAHCLSIPLATDCATAPIHGVTAVVEMPTDIFAAELSGEIPRDIPVTA